MLTSRPEYRTFPIERGPVVKRHLIGALLAFALARLPQLCVAETWTFEGVPPRWAAHAVADEPGVPTNRILRIDASRPHHTRVDVAAPVPPAFVLEARVRLLASSAPSVQIYVYALSADGFVALSLGGGRARLFQWHGQGRPSPTLGEISVPAGTGAWTRVKLGFENGAAAAKVWPDGTREPPGWPMLGQPAEVAVKGVALGVWLPPGKSASASALFDDLTLRPVVPADRIAACAAPAAPLNLPATAGQGVFDAPPHIGLVAGDLAVAFDRATGALRHLVHRPSGRDFCDAVQRRPLFRLCLTRWRAGESVDLSADDFAHVDWRTSDPKTLEATFRDGPETGLVVRARLSAGADGLAHFGLAHFGLAVENPSARAVASIQYPCFASPAALGGDAADDRLLFPQGLTDGLLVNAPGRQDRTLRGAYPGSAAVQMAALYDPAAGLLLATQDAEGHCKDFEARLSRDRFVELSTTHLCPETPGDAAIPYDTVLGTFTGDWRDAADLYKRWARNQPWCARKLTRRDDVPAFLKEGAAGVIFGIGGPSGYNGVFGPNLERLPAVAAAYRARAKVPHLIVVPYGWENRGTWAGIHYFPARPSDEAWRAANAALRAQGDRTAMLTSGYWWVVRRPRTSNGPAFDDTADFERRQAMTVRCADGTPWLVDATGKAGTFGDWRGLSAKLCHGSVDARAAMLDIFLKTAALGTPLISFDQEIGGGQSEPCYATDHGHPPGYGAWMWSDFRDLCNEIRAKGHDVNPELGLFVENCGEMIIPVMATYWSRQFGVLDPVSSGEGPVGLFSYLYHEYVTAIGAALVQGQGPNGAKISAGLRCQALANCLARGLIPCPFSNDAPLDAADPRRAEMARAFFAFCEPFGSFPEFLVLGETLHPPAVTCAVREEWFETVSKSKDKETTKGVRHGTRPLPCVVAGRFATPDGAVGTVLVNATPDAQRATVATGARGKRATLYRADKSVVADWAALPEKIDLDLEPFGTRLLVVRP